MLMLFTKKLSKLARACELQFVSKNWTATINMTSPVHKIYELFLVQRDLSQFSIDDSKKVGLESDPQFP